MTDAFICDAIRTPFGRYALCTMCIGVGQGLALIIERV
jgi:acetyl-CoA acetyltransferase